MMAMRFEPEMVLERCLPQPTIVVIVSEAEGAGSLRQIAVLAQWA